MMINRYVISLASIAALAIGGIGFRAYKNRAPYLTVIGFADMSDGLGRQSVEIMDTMRHEVSVGFRATTPSIYQDISLPMQKLMKKKYKRLGQVVVYEDIIHPFSHTFFQRRFELDKPDQIRIAYSMFESSEIPLRWVHNLNLYFDAVVVPDPFLIDTYKNSGVTLPIFVLPLGLNLQPFLKAPLKESPHTPFVFANFSTCIARKNHRDLIHAFHAAFGNNPDVLLWINSKYSKEHLFEDLQKEIELLGVTNIRLTNHCYNRTDYLDNFHQIDCYVSLSEAEGFSIQPREALALGIPCILSDNTGQATICNSHLVIPVSCPTEQEAYYEQFQEILGVRYHVDFDAAVNALQEMYTHYADHLSHANQLRTWATQYDYEQLKPLYRSLIKPTKILLGEENKVTEDYLMTDSPALYRKYQVITCAKKS